MTKVTAKRKSDHIRVNLEKNVRSGLSTGLERLRFEHNALPELDLRAVDTRLSFLGRQLDAPLLISSMTGGTEQARTINQALAEAAQQTRVAMGVGSLRAAIEDPTLANTYDVRRYAPDVLLFANLGAVQLNYGYGLTEAQRAVDLIGADALVLHLNALQEALQPEGDANFSGLLAKIEAICRGLPVPVVAKEVGWGISPSVARRLVDAGVAVIDVAGAGGTSWSQVEMHRSPDESSAAVASEFVDWGIPTAQALADLRRAMPELPFIASGGLQGGIDLAKALALGARIGGMAGPFLRAAVESRESVIELINRTVKVLRVAMFATGSPDLATLRNAKLVPAL
jgi:isopentenyl-diphosphate delta-isomerase